MVERVARAIDASLKITGPDHPTLGVWAAHAALVAMREPTPGMVRASEQIIVDNAVSFANRREAGISGSMNGALDYTARLAWQAAIDTALSESPEG